MSSPMRAALYARYSTESQSEASINDQLRVCERVAERERLDVVARFSDEAISAGTANRPGYQALLAAARRKEFEVIVVEDITRMWRNRAEFGPRSAELEDLGVHLVTAVGDDTRRDGWGLTIQLKQMIGEAQRRESSYRTYRGLEGRARSGKSTGGRAYGYIAARDSESGEREIHQEQAPVVRQIFRWYVDGKSPRWIAGELNRQGVPSPGASWNRTSQRLNAKRRRGWVPTAIHGDRARGTGILNNRAYVGELVWGRSSWKRSASDSKRRTWSLVSDASAVVVNRDERLRIVPQELWDAVKGRQQDTEAMSTALRGALKRRGRLPRHLLSGLLVCEECGGAFRCVNGREYGCASYRDGGTAACTNGVRVPIAVAEQKLLQEVAMELLSEEAIERLQRRLREHARRAADRRPEPSSTAAAEIARKDAELEELRKLVRSGKLSPAVAQAAIDRAEQERGALASKGSAAQERETARVIRVLPRAADLLRQRLGMGNLGLQDPRSIVQGRNVLFSLFGGRVPLRPGSSKPGERPFLVARLRLNQTVLLQAAGAGGCVESGSGGRI